MTSEGRLVTSSDLLLFRLLEPSDNLRAAVALLGGEVIRVGPFEAYLHPDPHVPGFEYAQPIEPLPGDDEVVAALGELRALFASRSLPVSIEFNTPLFPRLPDLLAAAGLVLSEREPLLVLDPANFTPVRVAGVEVHFLHRAAPDERLSAYSRIFTEVLLERPYSETPEGIVRLRQEVEKTDGRSHALARFEGRPVGTGFISDADGVSEITRVATIPDVRRRGVAATLTSAMLEEHLGPDARLAWLTASGQPAQQLYEKLGFRVVGERLYYSEP
jgi:ribosomal protein S18 acetylase RimI-like enzyme